VTPTERYEIKRKATALLRQRADAIARVMTLQQGKPMREVCG
jgi:acyl-CoA reductase-like NAD-dependent aldehyde dehydrogenase